MIRYLPHLVLAVFFSAFAFAVGVIVASVLGRP